MKPADLLAQALRLSPEERRLLADTLIDGIEPIGMKAVTVVLPDELANQAQAAGLFGEKQMEEILRRALSEQNASAHGSRARSARKRRLVRDNGRLVVEAMPGEQPITEAEVRDLLNKMEW